ncbi:helix-turn-helix transcriptional regulator [Corallococcus sp. BB11-1]|uniref:helix-turn-helix transcriptional regulator n=1 Tax=Corallococcus sp. BB11-1 TaxID=2996783 RepID=UPI002271A767|nr:helix-turn-helix transcriptional regulator [Corallococcus sp. BB11-1]MCY1033954.1 helix-turn-helix transcriptional regulator [Corallococcus sp. BB11-1]
MGRAMKFLAREQALILELKDRLHGARTLEAIYEAIATTLARLCEADHIAIGCVNPDGSAGLQWKTDTVQPLLRDYSDWAQDDFVFHATVVQPNVVLNDTQMLQGRSLEETETFRRSQDAGLNLRRVMASLLFEAQGLKGSIAMYREASRAFSLRAQWLLQQLVPYIAKAMATVQELYAYRFENDLLKVISMEPNPSLVLNVLGRKVVESGTAIPLLAKWFSSHELHDGVPQEWTRRVRELSRFDEGTDFSLQALVMERGEERLEVTFTPSTLLWAGRMLWQVRLKEHAHWLRQDWLRLLSDRELEVANGLYRGATNKEIAQELKRSTPKAEDREKSISVETVKVHVKSIFAKTGASSRAEFVAHGRRS